MDHSPPPTSAHPTSDTLKQILTDVREFIVKEPVAAVSAVCAVGLLVKLLPRAWVVGTVGVVGTALIKPALISLGMTKAVELYLQRPHTNRTTAPGGS